MTDEQAKAVQEIAKTSRELGHFLGKVFGTVPEDVAGLLLGDWLREYRIRNCAKLRSNTLQILRECGHSGPTRAVMPKFGVALLDAVSIEEDEELHDLWARLLANAMDPGFKHDVNRSFITILQDFTPLEAVLLKRLHRFTVAQPKEQKFDVRTKHFRKDVGDDRIGRHVIPKDNVLVAWMNLDRLGCVDITRGAREIRHASMTELGLALARACMELSPTSTSGVPPAT